MLPGPRTPPAQPTPEGLRPRGLGFAQGAVAALEELVAVVSIVFRGAREGNSLFSMSSRALNLHPPLALIPGQGGSCSSSLQTKPCSFHRWEGRVAARRGTAARPQPGCVTSGAKGRGFGGQGWAVHLLKVTAAAQHPNLFRCSVCC